MLVVPAAVAVLQELDRAPGWAEGLRTRVEARLGGSVPIYRSHVTAALAMLAKDGLVALVGEERRPGGAGSPRRVFAITARGQTEAARQRKTAEAFWRDALGALVDQGGDGALQERVIVLDEEGNG